jgi:predicted hydrocarbon binding protein
MAFKPPPAILQRVMKFKAIQHKNGKFLLWDIPCFISELYTFIYEQRLLEDELGINKTASIFYNMGQIQVEKSAKMITERFGYAKTITERSKLADFNIGQSEMVGLGQFKFIRKDFDNGFFIVRGKSPIAEEYRRFFGIQKNHVDYLIRGMVGGMGNWLMGKKCLCVESQCLATGKQYCEFLIKPVEKWDKEDPLYKSQPIEKVKNMKELGARIEPYIFSP